MKLSNEQIEKSEASQMADALGNCLELNADFIARYCGEAVAKLLLQIPESEREFALQGCIGEGYFSGYVYVQRDDEIVLPSSEIEVQFEGSAEDVFETPNELTIHGNLAYLYTGYGLILPIDVKKLAINVAEFLTA